MQDPNILNVPAYKRKRSIAAKARKKTSYTKTTTRKKRRKTGNIEPTPSPNIAISEILPTEESFPEPFEASRSHKGLREMKEIGICEGYFDNINVAVIKLTSPLREGDNIIFEKNGGLFEQEVLSMQINRKDVTLARTGSDVGLKVHLKPKVGTSIYKVI